MALPDPPFPECLTCGNGAEYSVQVRGGTHFILVEKLVPIEMRGGRIIVYYGVEKYREVRDRHHIIFESRVAYIHSHVYIYIF